MDDIEWAQRRDNLNKRIAARKKRSLLIFGAFFLYLTLVITVQGILS